MTTEQIPSLDEQLSEIEPRLVQLFKALKRDIGDEYRASDDPDDSLPGMQVTIGFTPATADSGYSWHYQTGDNSYSGGAYSHHHWGVVSLYRKSNSAEVAADCLDQIGESVFQSL